MLIILSMLNCSYPAAEVITSLETSQNNCGGAPHHHAWNQEEIPGPCRPEVREGTTGCCHSSQLRLRSSILIAEEINIITEEERDRLFQFVTAVQERLFEELDETARELQEAIIDNSTGEIKKLVEEIGAKLGDVKSYELALAKRQQRISSPLVILRKVMLQALHPDSLDNQKLKEFIPLASLYTEKAHNFENSAEEVFDNFYSSIINESI